MKLSHDPDPGPSLPLQVKTIDGKAVSFGIFSAEMQMILQDHRRHIWFECIVHLLSPLTRRLVLHALEAGECLSAFKKSGR